MNRRNFLSKISIVATAATVAPVAVAKLLEEQKPALNLGFKSFQRNGYTFYKTDWELLNSPVIVKDAYVVSSSDISRIQWAKPNGYCWYLSTEKQTLERFENKIKTIMFENGKLLI